MARRADETLPEMMKRNGHSSIDVLKIDCDGCEYEMYEQLGQIDFQQLLIEIHHYPAFKGIEWTKCVAVYFWYQLPPRGVAWGVFLGLAQRFV